MAFIYRILFAWDRLNMFSNEDSFTISHVILLSIFQYHLVHIEFFKTARGLHYGDVKRRGVVPLYSEINNLGIKIKFFIYRCENLSNEISLNSYLMFGLQPPVEGNPLKLQIYVKRLILMRKKMKS